jgi:hypothetical protein
MRRVFDKHWGLRRDTARRVLLQNGFDIKVVLVNDDLGL